MRWIKMVVAAALPHQVCPVPFFDFDIVARAGGRITTMNFKVGELQPQHLPTLYLYRLCLLKVVRINTGMVWRGDNTCSIYRYEVLIVDISKL